jgi:hypothetical protein
MHVHYYFFETIKLSHKQKHVSLTISSHFICKSASFDKIEVSMPVGFKIVDFSN